jgi:type II secretory pathway component GspD/PulD (secretin)
LELDSPSEYAVPHRRFLSYALASDILPAIEAGVAHDKTELDEAHGTETTQSNSQTQTQQQAQQAQTPNTGSSDSSSPNLSVTPIIPSVEYSAPKVVTIGKTKIMADDRSNSIIVFSTPDVVDRVFSLIDELDRRPIQVYLATVIGQLSISNSSEFGIDLLQKYTHASGFGVAGSSVVSPNTTSSAAVPEPYSLSSAGSFPLLSPGTLGGLTLYGALSSTINAYVRALSSTGHFKVLSCPSVYTTNNKSAYIASGQQVPVPTNTTSGFTGSSTNLTTTASVGYKNVVLSLQIIPLINANHQVTLTIQQTNDTVGSNVSIGGNSVPVVNTQVINTKITVADRSTVVIGGLISNTETVNTSGVPYLQDIPVVGGLFKDKTKSKMRSELVILIQPNVIDSDADQVANDARQAERTTLVGDSRDLLNEKVPTPTPTPTPRPTHISVTTGNSTRYR